MLLNFFLCWTTASLAKDFSVCSLLHHELYHFPRWLIETGTIPVPMCIPEVISSNPLGGSFLQPWIISLHIVLITIFLKTWSRLSISQEFFLYQLFALWHAFLQTPAHFGLPRPSALSPQFRKTARLCLASSFFITAWKLSLCGKFGQFQSSLRFVSYCSEITLLHCLISKDLRCFRQEAKSFPSYFILTRSISSLILMF